MPNLCSGRDLIRQTMTRKALQPTIAPVKLETTFPIATQLLIDGKYVANLKRRVGLRKCAKLDLTPAQ